MYTIQDPYNIYIVDQARYQTTIGTADARMVNTDKNWELIKQFR